MGKTHVVKWFFGVFLLCLLILGYRSEASAATYGPEDIGKRTDDTSIVGVNLYCDDRLMYYVYDLWQKNGNTWVYDSSNNNGCWGEYLFDMNNSNLIWILDPEKDSKHLGINLNNVFYKYGGTYEDYSVIIEHYYNNKLIRSYLETPFDDLDSYYQNLSLMYACKQKEYMVKVTSYSALSASYKYKLYKILQIKQDGDIKVASGNWSVTSPGAAYYNGSGYIIHSLPQVTPAFEGYTCTFDGWYSAVTGGKKYEVGDVIEKGATIYPRWTKTANAYSVQCIDILGKNASGLKLGESTWVQSYGSVARGSQAGCIPTESMYYEGTIYTGCSQCTVGTSGNVVYRYFDYAEYPVQIVDRIALGPNAGKELGKTSRQGRYQTSISGSVLGTDPGAGVYYQGYYYQQSTSSIIGKGGVTVYRNFVPVQYDIVFHGNGATDGNMDTLQGCWYDRNYTLIPNSYQKEIHISFDLQAENAVCDNREKKILLPWKGWAESSTGGVRYSDQDSVQNLSSNGQKKDLYAVWNPAEITITSVPKRMGYIFAGWSENRDAEAGNMEFRLQTDTTLYAIWKPDIVNYHVEYYKEEPDGSFQLATQYQFSNYTDSMISIEDTIPDYQGFYLDRGSSTLQGTVQGDGSLVLMVYYRRNSYQIDFDEMTEDGILQPLQGVYEQKVQIPDYVPQREGYQFKGWTADPDSTQVYCMPGDSYR
ncbi:MAG: InlB B-repeat-containing protein, partial [Lachnospiraceae bacterium]|nr:InlB B-repeat-containing protein [Lachnospiraceae bacterium]